MESDQTNCVSNCVLWGSFIFCYDMTIKYHLNNILLTIFLFVALFYLVPFFMYFALQHFSKINYAADYQGGSGIYYLGFLAISIYSTYWNFYTLTRIDRRKIWIQWMFMILDLLMVGVSIICIMLYNNSKLGMPSVEELINPFVFLYLISIKNVLLLLFAKRMLKKLI